MGTAKDRQVEDLRPAMARSGRASKQKRRPRHEDRVCCRVCGEWLRIITGSHLRTHDLTAADYKSLFDVGHLACGETRRKMSELHSSGRASDRFVPRTKTEIIEDIRREVSRRAPDAVHQIRNRAPKLVAQAAYVFGDWITALEAAGFSAKRSQRWSVDRVVERIRRRARAKRPLSIMGVKNEDRALYAAAVTHFGGWRRAVEASGFDYSRIRKLKARSRETVARDLGVWSRANGPLNARALKAADAPLYQATHKLFGSVENAARVLDLPFYGPLQHWTPERVVEEIRSRVSRRRPLDATSVEEDDSRLLSAAYRYFGTWGRAVEAAGFDYSRSARHKTRTRATVARDVRAWARDHGPLNSTALENTDPGMRKAAVTRFGSLEQAARSLRLPFRRRTKAWSRERVAREIKRRETRGLSLRGGTIALEDSALYHAACRYHGNWRRALEDLGYAYSDITACKVRTRESVAGDLRAWVREHGPLQSRALSLTDSGLEAAVRKHFGSLERAAGQLGLPYRLRRRLVVARP